MIKINNIFFLYLTFAISFFETLVLIFIDEGLATSLKYFFYIHCFLILQIFLLLVLNKLKNLFLKNIIISLVLSFNFIVLKLSYTSIYLSISNFFQFIIFILFSIIFLFILCNLNKNKVFNFLILFSSFSFLIVPLIYSFLSGYSFVNMKTKIGIKESIKWATFQSGIIEKKNWSKIKFEKKPNVYIVSFDSVPSIKNIKKIIKTDNIELENYLTSKNANIFEESFSMNIPTVNAINSLLMLDQNNFKLDKRRFSGQIDSLLYLVFRNNGYEITSGYAGNYLGKKKGRYLDKYVTMSDSILNTTLCIENVNFVAFILPRSFLFCKLYSLNKNLKNSFNEKHGNKSDIHKWQNKVIELIKTTENRPQLKILHLYRPIGHTPGDYITGNVKQQAEFLKDDFLPGIDQLTEIIKKIVSINENKSGANDNIIFFTSDHGPWMSRTYDKLDKFYYQDRHSVFSVLIDSKNLCGKSFDPYFSYYDEEQKKYITLNKKKEKSFTSPGRILTSIIKCISNKNYKEFLDKNVDFEVTNKFEKYLN